MPFHEDDRGQRIFDIFPTVNGQINTTIVNSTDHVVAWHRHKIQTDYWFCVKGSFKCGIGIPQQDGLVKVEWHYLSDKNCTTLAIPPDVWHGNKALQPESIMLYYLTEKYNPNDEFRVPVGYFGEEWVTENK